MPYAGRSGSKVLDPDAGSRARLLRKRTSNLSDDENRRMLEGQVLKSKCDSFWSQVKNGDRDGVLQAVKETPSLLQRRGVLGETPLHQLVLFRHFDLAKIIAARYPELILDVYLEPLYEGETCLHIAIVMRDLSMVRFLLDTCKQHGTLAKLLASRVNGSFFQKGKHCYYGQTPLDFAVSTDQVDLVREMVWKYSANPMLQDSQGSNLLHLSVWHRLPAMYDAVFDIWKEFVEQNTATRNTRCFRCGSSDNPETDVDVDGLTPLSLAAKRGLHDMFSHILKKSCETQWTFGPVASLLLPLEGLDFCQGPQKSALEHVIREGHLDLISVDLVQELLARKWRLFAQQIFMRRLFLALLNAILFNLMTVFPLPKLPGGTPDQQGEMDRIFYHLGHTPFGFTEDLPRSWVRVLAYLACKVYVVCWSSRKLYVELREMSTSGPAGYFDMVGAQMWENVVSLTFCLSFFAYQWLLIIESPNAGAMFSACALLCWLYLLWFLLGFSKTGQLVVMVSTILMGDMVYFSCLTMLFLMGFSLTFFTVTTDIDDRCWGSFTSHFLDFFHGSLSGFDKDGYREGTPASVTAFLLMYSILFSVVLLNLLIAMMNDTFNKVSGEAHHQWQLERARIIHSIECELQHDPPEYWLDIHGIKYLQIEQVATSDGVQYVPLNQTS